MSNKYCKVFNYLDNLDFMSIDKLINDYKNYQDTCELEVRFGEFNNKNSKFTPKIDERIYNNIVDFVLNPENNINHISENVEYKNVYDDGTLEIITLKDSNFEMMKKRETLNESDIEYIKYSKKNKMKTIDIHEYGLRFCLSKEIDCNKTKNTDVMYSTKKYKNRYEISGVYLDLVKYMVNGTDDVEFSFEIEFHSKDVFLEKILELIYNIIQIIQNTDDILSKTEKQFVLSEYMKIAGLHKPKFIGVQPHTIKLDKIIKNKEYALTYKLDGLRKLLFITGRGQAYYISNSLVIQKTNYVFWDGLDGTILDGEYYNNDYYIFDVLYYKGQYVGKSVQLKDKIYCMNELLEFQVFKSDDHRKNHLYVKEFIFNHSVYDGLNMMIKNMDIKKYDGIIIEPIDCDGHTLKWKPEEMNTVDLKVKKIGTDKAILLCVTKKGEEYYEYEKKGVCVDGLIKNKEIVNTLKNGRIYEFTYNTQFNEFIPIRERKDKIKPNYIDVVNDNIESILYPLKIELVKRNEEKFYNLKRYHNWIKRLFIEKYASHKNLLDIACGRGGDIQKWVDYKIKYVEAYDIDKDSIDEARIRFSNITKTIVYKTNLNYEFEVKDILEEKIKESRDETITVTTAFFCMHYFFENMDKFFSNIDSTQETGSIFICCFQDKERIDEYLKSGRMYDEFKLKTLDDNKIVMSMKDTIVDQERQEYVCTHNDVVNKFNKYGYQLVEHKNFQDFYKKWTKNIHNSMEEYEKAVSFFNNMYVFRKI